MSYSRKELMTQINEEREKAKNKLLYTAGITKLKKDELNEIVNDLKTINKAYVKEKEEEEKKALEEDKRELEDEKERLTNELKRLDNDSEEAKCILEELDFDDEDDAKEEERVEEEYKKEEEKKILTIDENYDAFLNYDNNDLTYEEIDEEEEPQEKNNINEYNMPEKNITQTITRITDNKEDNKDDKKSDEPMLISRNELKNKKKDYDTQSEEEEDVEKYNDNYYEKKNNDKTGYTLTLKQAEDQIKETITNFKDIMDEKIKEVKRFKRMGLLTQKFIDQVINEHNFYRTEAEDQIADTMDNLRGDLDFSRSFVSMVNRQFNNILEKTEKAVS